MFLCFKLSLVYLSRENLQALSLVCTDLNDIVREEMWYRTHTLARIAYKCIKENPNALVMAGSMPLWLRSGGPTHWFPKDVDIFWYGGKRQIVDGRWDDEECIVHFNADGKHHGVKFLYNIRPLVTTIQTHNGNVQFILSSHFETIESVLTTFDLTCCRIGSTEPENYTALEGFSTKTFKTLECTDETVSKGEESHKIPENILLTQIKTERTHKRAMKYENRGLENCGTESAGLEVLTFFLLYKKTECMIFENRLVDRDPERNWHKCSCTSNSCRFVGRCSHPLEKELEL